MIGSLVVLGPFLFVLNLRGRLSRPFPSSHTSCSYRLSSTFSFSTSGKAFASQLTQSEDVESAEDEESSVVPSGTSMEAGLSPTRRLGSRRTGPRDMRLFGRVLRGHPPRGMLWSFGPGPER